MRLSAPHCPPCMESSLGKACHQKLNLRIYTVLIWERNMRGKRTSDIWFLVRLLFFIKRCCVCPLPSSHPTSWEKVLLSPLPSSSSSSSSSSSVYKIGPSESESVALYSLWPSSSEALKDSEDSPISPGASSWGAAFPNSSLVVKLSKAQKHRGGVKLRATLGDTQHHEECLLCEHPSGWRRKSRHRPAKSLKCKTSIHYLILQVLDSSSVKRKG